MKEKKKKLKLKVDRINVLDVKESKEVYGGKSGHCNTKRCLTNEPKCGIPETEDCAGS